MDEMMLALDVPHARHPLGSTAREHRFWTTSEIPALCDRAGNRELIEIVGHLTGAPPRIAVDWFRGMEAVGRRSRSRRPTAEQRDAFVQRLALHVRMDERADPDTMTALFQRVAEVAYASDNQITGPEWLAWTTIREKIEKYRYDRFTAWVELVQRGDIVRFPGRDNPSNGVTVQRLRTTPRGKVVITDKNKITFSVERGTLVRIARPDPTFGAPALALRDRRRAIVRGVYGCTYEATPGLCEGRCGRPQCLMEAELRAREP